MANPTINPDLVVAHKFPEASFPYTERDVALYALGVGACGRDAVDVNELKYVYHSDGQQFLKVLPTFPALFSLGSIPTFSSIPGMEFDPKLLLHGQQYIEIYKPLPANSRIRNKSRIAGLHDKGTNICSGSNVGLIYCDQPPSSGGNTHDVGKAVATDFPIPYDTGSCCKAAILEIETTTYADNSGEPLCMNRTTVFLRGAGGFSKSSPPYSFTNYSGNQTPAIKIPKTQPFASYEDITGPSQALLYRLSGDYNPLHSDPKVAEIAGFPRPILHGLCTLGFAIRAVIRCICRGDPDIVKSLSGRFLLHVFPGETLITQMWLEGLRVIYQVNVKDRNKAVLSGHVDLHRLSSQL